MRADYLISRVLTEDRMPGIHAKWGAKLNTEHDENVRGHPHGRTLAINRIANMDPTGNRQYTDRLLHWYHHGQFRLEDHQAVHDTVKRFHQIKGRMEPADRDINKHKTLGDLRAKLEPFQDAQTKSQADAAEKADIEHGSTVIHDSPKLQVREIHTKSAACGLGVGTEWCTAIRNDNNQFDHYRQFGQLYSIHDKTTGEKHQVHFNAGQLMDKHDREVDSKTLSNKHPELLKLFHGRHVNIFNDHKRLEQHALSIAPGTLEDVADLDSTHFARNFKPGEHHPTTISMTDTLGRPRATQIRFAVLNHRETSPETIDKMFDQAEQASAAQAHKGHPSDRLSHKHWALQNEYRAMVHKLTGLHEPNTSAHTLTKMVNSPHVGIDEKIAALKHRNGGGAVVRAAASHANPEIRTAAARHVESTEMDVLAKLHTDPEPMVRDQAMQNTLSTPEMRHQAVVTPAGSPRAQDIMRRATRHRALERHALPETLHHIVQSEAENPSEMGIHPLEMALSKASEHTQKWFAHTGYDTYKSKLDKSNLPAINRHWARNPDYALAALSKNRDLHPEVAAHLARHHLDKRAGREALFHSATGLDVAREIAKDKTRPEHHRALASYRLQYAREHQGKPSYAHYLSSNQLEDPHES